MAKINFHKVLSTDATVYDTLTAIVDSINQNKTSEFCKEAAKAFGPSGDKLAYIKRVYTWICNNVAYKEDFPGIEVIYTPQLVVLMGQSDCKKHTILFASIIAAAGIEPVLKHVYYAGRTDISHIYCIVPLPDIKHYVCCDTTICDFGAEVNYKSATLYFLNGEHMELHSMGHLNRDSIMDEAYMATCGFGNSFSNIGAATFSAIGFSFKHAFHFPSIKQIWHGVQEDVKKVEHSVIEAAKVFEKVSLAIPRAVYLEAVRLNAAGHAGHLLKAWKANPGKIETFWKDFGGDPNALKKAMLVGGAKHPLLGPDQASVGIAPLALLAACAPILTGAAIVIHAIDPKSPISTDVMDVANAANTAATQKNFDPAAILTSAGIRPDNTPGTSEALPPGSQFNDKNVQAGFSFDLQNPLVLAAGAGILYFLLKK